MQLKGRSLGVHRIYAWVLHETSLFNEEIGLVSEYWQDLVQIENLCQN